MSRPKFTIGIPTYNRAGFLERSLRTACDQTLDGVEVLVSDNASTDGTRELVERFGGRVRYHRNAENIGMWPNFALLAELAEGEYFSWLQDDDLIHCDFARRAAEAFDCDKNIVIYSGYSVDTNSYDTFVLPLIYGPPIALDWMRPRVRIIDGFQVLPISFFVSFSIPPVVAYRTEVIRRAVRDINPSDILFNERIIQSRAATEGKAAVEPWTAGTFYKHEMQGSRLAGSCDIPERSRHWLSMAEALRRMLEERPEKDWRPYLEAWLEEVSPQDRITLLNQLPPIQYWSQFHPLTREICSRILDRIPDFERRQFLAPLEEGGHLNGDGHRTPIKDLGRRLAPPLLWDVLRKVKRSMTAAP